MLLRGHIICTLELSVCQENSLEQVPFTTLYAVMQKLSINTQITYDSSDVHEYVQCCM